MVKGWHALAAIATGLAADFAPMLVGQKPFHEQVWERMFPPAPTTIRKPVTTNPLMLDKRPIAEIKNDLAQKLASDQNIATRTLQVVKNISDNIQKGYPLSEAKVNAALQGITQQRLSQAMTRKNMVKQTVAQQLQRKKALDAQIKELETRITKLSVPTDSLEKVSSGVWMSKDGRILEASELEGEQKRESMQRHSQVEGLRRQIETLKNQMPDMTQAYKQLHEAQDAVETAKEEQKGISRYVS